MRFAPHKCTVMSRASYIVDFPFGKSSGNGKDNEEIVKEEEPDSCFKIGSQKLKICDSFRYLGIMFTSDGIDWTASMVARSKKAKQRIGHIQFKEFISKGWEIKRKCILYQTFIRPNWNLERILQSFQNSSRGTENGTQAVFCSGCIDEYGSYAPGS